MDTQLQDQVQADIQIDQPIVRSPGRTKGLATTYTPDLWTEICERIASGESLRSVCRDPAMPDWMTVWRWMSGKVKAVPEDERVVMWQLYRDSRNLQADALREDIQAMGDSLIEYDEDGNPVARGDANAINAMRARIDAAKWIAERQAPERWGNKHLHGGLDGGPLQFAVMSYAVPSPAIEGERDD